MAKYDLAKIVDSDQLPSLQKMEEFLAFINTDPPETWLEQHPLAKGVKYVPIGRVEWLLDRIFQQWKPEVLNISTMFNSITCTVRLHYKHPVTGEWTYADGVAAVPAKTDQGAKASDMSAIKSEAVMTGLPAAKSFAIKDAADHIGKIFGRDINRKQNLDFIASYTPDEATALSESIKGASTEEELQNIMQTLPAEYKRAYMPAIKNRLEVIRNVNTDTSGAA
jgi:hypothetical protein